MFAAVAKSIFGSANDRYVRGLGKYVEAVNGFEPNISALSDDELRGQTDVFRQRLANGEKLDDLTERILSPPLVHTRSPSGTLANTMAGEPLLSWQVRQWHQPQSKGSLLSSYVTAPHMHPPVSPMHRPLID